MKRQTAMDRSAGLRQHLVDKSAALRQAAAEQAPFYVKALSFSDKACREEKTLLLAALWRLCESAEETREVRKQACDSLKELNEITQDAWATKVAAITGLAPQGQTTIHTKTILDVSDKRDKKVAKDNAKSHTATVPDRKRKSSTPQPQSPGAAAKNEGESLSQGLADNEQTEEARPGRVIHLVEVGREISEVTTLHAPVVARFQEFLDKLVGRRGATPGENKQIAEEVYDAARFRGIQLLWERQPIHFRWNQGVFEARTPDAARDILCQSADFPHLTAMAKALPEKARGR